MERRSGRFANSQTLLLSWEEHLLVYRQLGSVTDLESGGLSVLADRSIQIGTPVTVSCLSFLDFGLRGIVNHVSRQSSRYFIGIEFTPSINTAAFRFQSERWAA
jgi:hypothetical protein